MEKFLNLTEEQFQDLDKRTDAICEENEKFPGNALFFLVNAHKSSSKIILMCKSIILYRKFSKDHELLCGLNMHFDLVSHIRNRDLLPEKREEILRLYDVAHKAGILFSSFIAKDTSKIEHNLRVHQYLKESYLKLIEYIIERDHLLEAFSQTEIAKHIPLALFVMNCGRFSEETAKHLLENFIEKNQVA